MIENEMCTMVVEPKAEKVEQTSTSTTTTTNTTKSRCRKWTEEEVSLYAAVIADPKYGFAASLESLAAKKSSNTDLFSHVKHVLDQALEDGGLKDASGLRRYRATHSLKGYEEIDTSIEKLRKKYSNLKSEWRRRSEIAKSTGGLDLDREPRWFQILNSIFPAIGMTAESSSSECSSINVYSKSHAMASEQTRNNGSYIPELEIEHSYEHAHSEAIPIIYSREGNPPVLHSRDTDTHYKVHSSNEGMPTNSLSNAGKVPNKISTKVLYDFRRTSENNNSMDEENEKIVKEPKRASRRIIKAVQSPHRKRKLDTPLQAICDIAKGMQNLVSSQLRLNELIVGNELKRDEMFYKFCSEQAEKNRAHELRLAELYSSIANKTKEPSMIQHPSSTMNSKSNMYPPRRNRPMLFDRTFNEFHVSPVIDSIGLGSENEPSAAPPQCNNTGTFIVNSSRDK